MKKILYVFSGIIIGLIVSALIMNSYNLDKKIYENAKESKQMVNSNALTMMYETSSGSGEYEVSSDTSWPQEGYIFNEELSSCENGGKLSWNKETKKVVMQSNSSDKCYVYFDKYTSIEITNVSTSNITNNSITLTVNATAGENPIKTYYYSNNGGTSYVESVSNSYTFSGLSTGTEYDFRVYAVDSAGYTSNVYSLKESTSNAVYLAEYIKGLYTSDGENGLYLHDGSGTYGAQEAGDNSYRYSGANPNNYVCFGSDASTCPNDNLYRIIGVFGNQVKLIKYDYAGSNLLGTNGDYVGTSSPSSYSTYKGSQSTLYDYYWNNNTSTNTWSESQLNTVNLNQNYLNNIGSTWSSKIATTSWKVGGNTYQNIYSVPVKTVYQNEIVSPAESTTYSSKIGLMYASDYGYATSPNNWNTNLSNYNSTTVRDNNWMWMGYYDWTITRRSDTTLSAFFVYDTGFVSSGSVFDYSGVRPSFYLNSNVTLSGGSGSSADPFRLGL